jgi:hypothetical protein
MAEISFRITDLETAYIIGGLYHLLRAFEDINTPLRDRDAVKALLRKLAMPLDIEPETLNRLGIPDLTGNA